MSARMAKAGGGRAAQARSKARSGGGGSRAGSARRQKPDEGMFESLGFEPGAARRILGWSVAALVMVSVVAAVFAFRLPQLAGLAIGEGIGQMGLTCARRNAGQAASDPGVYNIAFNQDSPAMPLVDLERTRARLLALPWIREARVSRRLPDTLVIEVIERVPVAIWQDPRGRQMLIDAEGVSLEPVRIEAVPDLPRLTGPGANSRFAALKALIDTVPRLRPQVTEAHWIGQRRWDIHFQSGEILTLPEGEEEARRAILRFAQLDQRDSLLGRGFARIDMRDPTRAYVRISREPGARVPSAPPAPDPGQIPRDLSETI